MHAVGTAERRCSWSTEMPADSTLLLDHPQVLQRLRAAFAVLLLL